MLNRLKSLYRKTPNALMVAGGFYILVGLALCLIGLLSGTLCVVAALSPFESGPCASIPAHNVIIHFARSIPLILMRLLLWPYWALGFSDTPFLEWAFSPWLSAPGTISTDGSVFDLLGGAAIGIICLLLCIKCLRGMVRTIIESARFWHIAMKDPDAVYDFIMSSPDWFVFTTEPAEGFKAHLPPGEWDGPHVLDSKNGRPRIHAFGHIPGYEGSQQDFVARYKANKQP